MITASRLAKDCATQLVLLLPDHYSLPPPWLVCLVCFDCKFFGAGTLLAGFVQHNGWPLSVTTVNSLIIKPHDLRSKFGSSLYSGHLKQHFKLIVGVFYCSVTVSARSLEGFGLSITYCSSICDCFLETERELVGQTLAGSQRKAIYSRKKLQFILQLVCAF